MTRPRHLKGAKHVGADLRPKDLRAGDELHAPRKGLCFKVVRVNQGRIFAYMRRSNLGRWGTTLIEVLPAELIGYLIIPGGIQKARARAAAEK